jgi:hypothetical protein
VLDQPLHPRFSTPDQATTLSIPLSRELSTNR